MFRTLCPALLVLAACSSSGLEGFPVDGADGDVVQGEFIITADLGPALEDALGVAQLDWDVGLNAGLYLAEADGVSRAGLEAALKRDVDRALRVEHNRPVRMSGVDTYRYLQWNMDMLDIERAWEDSTGSGVTVAVIDSGVSWAGEDRPAHLVAGWDYVDDDDDPTDLNGHGTHVAGTIAQATGNDLGVVGVAPDASILAYRVLDAQGYGSAYWTAKAILAAADAGAQVANLSLGSSAPTQTEEDAIAYATSVGMVVVAASGNAGSGQLDYPARYGDTVAVGAVRADQAVTSYSNGGPGLDLVAPGGDVGVDQNGDGYADGVLQETLEGYLFFEGTSMATPHVAGAAALLLAAGAVPDDVRSLLTRNADKVAGPGWDRWYGHGILDVNAALADVRPPEVPDEPDEPDAPTPDDDTAPVISGVGGERNGSSLTLWWQTDEPATTEINFEIYGWFGELETLTTEHELQFTIDPAETYRFTFIAQDAAGNGSEDAGWYSAP